MTDIVKGALFIGDIHGEWDLLKKTIKQFEIKDCYLICVGDLGIGFAETLAKERHIHADLNKFFAARDIHFMSIRGNHDDPKYFAISHPWKWSHFELIPDYTTKIINGEKYQFVGGGLSIDRSGNHRRLNSTYWSDEGFILDTTRAKRCDVLVTHSAPSWSGPNNKGSFIQSWEKHDPLLWEACLSERKDHDQLYEICCPNFHYAGHFHKYYYTCMSGSVSIILDILQIKEHNIDKCKPT